MEQERRPRGRPKKLTDQPSQQPRTRFRVKELAEAKGLGISELSRLANVARTVVHHLWHNQVARVDLLILERIADALGVRVHDLLADDEKQSPDAL